MRANHVTVLVTLLSFVGGGLIAWRPDALWPFLALPPFLFIRMALNAIDGMPAREHGQKTALGTILNEIGDVLSDAALYLPPALTPFFLRAADRGDRRARDRQRDDGRRGGPDRRLAPL